MKAVFGVLAVLATAVSAQSTLMICNADNCLRAIRNTSRPGLAQCVSYFITTVTPDRVTVTETQTFQTDSTQTNTITSTVPQSELTSITETSTKTVYLTDTTSQTDTETETSLATASSTTTAKVTQTITIPITVTTVFTTVTLSSTVASTSTTLVRRCISEVPSAIPAYASPCSGSVRYSSACSCMGATASTITVDAPETTVVESTTQTNVETVETTEYESTTVTTETETLTATASTSLVISTETQTFYETESITVTVTTSTLITTQTIATTSISSVASTASISKTETHYIPIATQYASFQVRAISPDPFINGSYLTSAFGDNLLGETGTSILFMTTVRNTQWIREFELTPDGVVKTYNPFNFPSMNLNRFKIGRDRLGAAYISWSGTPQWDDLKCRITADLFLECGYTGAQGTYTRWTHYRSDRSVNAPYPQLVSPGFNVNAPTEMWEFKFKVVPFTSV
ncbi:hypothetical protein TWF281_004005 [Arthrobotrys megalospora]